MLFPILKQIADAVIEPVTLDEVKAHLRVSDSVEDALIAALAKAARRHIEAVSGNAMIVQQWLLTYSAFPMEPWLLARPFPVRTVDEFKYWTIDGSPQTLTVGSQIELAAESGRICLVGNGIWPPALLRVADPIQAKVTCGMSDVAAGVPENLKIAIKLLAGHWFENREATGPDKIAELPFAVRALIAPFQRF